MKIVGRIFSWLSSALVVSGLLVLWSPQVSYALMDGPAGSALAQAFLTYGVQRTFPPQYIFINTGLAAPPNRVVEILVSPHGNDDFETNPQWYKGFTIGTAFATPQGCYNYIQQVFTMNGVLPMCRIAAGTYTGKIEISGAPHGRQIQGGGQITLWGTCANTGSPNNGVVGFSAGGADVLLQSNGGQSLISLVNGAFVQVTCVTTSADIYHFYSQQFSNIIINSGVRTIVGPGGLTSAILRADNNGQIYASGMTVFGGASVAFAQATQGSNIQFYGGANSITFSGTPSLSTTLVASDNSIINVGNASTFTGAVTGANKCSIAYGAGLIDGSTGSSIPGAGTCSISSATFAYER